MGIQVPISYEVSGVTMHNLDTQNYSSIAKLFFEQMNAKGDSDSLRKVASKLFPDLTLLH